MDVKKKTQRRTSSTTFTSKRARVYKRFLKYTENTKFTRANHAFLYISLPSLRLHDYDVKLPNNIMFYGGREQATTKFSFSLWTWIYVVVYRNSTSGKFANIWQSKWVGDKVGELLHDPYFITFGHVFLDKNLGLVDSIYLRFGNSIFWNLISLSRAKFKVGFQPK